MQIERIGFSFHRNQLETEKPGEQKPSSFSSPRFDNCTHCEIGRVVHQGEACPHGVEVEIVHRIAPLVAENHVNVVGEEPGQLEAAKVIHFAVVVGCSEETLLKALVVFMLHHADGVGDVGLLQHFRMLAEKELNDHGGDKARLDDMQVALKDANSLIKGAGRIKAPELGGRKR